MDFRRLKGWPSTAALALACLGVVRPAPALAADGGADTRVAAATTLPSVRTEPFWNPALTLNDRVDDLVGRMTLEEKVAQLQNRAPAIDRIGLPAYNYWSEALHGTARNGTATVFPEPIGLACTFDDDAVHQMADVISTEARAKYNEAIKVGIRSIYFGLSLWSPNINIFRDPRWGRGQETYGEDPFLTGRMGVAFIKGLQGADPRYFKTIACAKHYAVHSGPEPLRHKFDAAPPERDLYETYLPQFEAAVREGHVQQVMSAYSAIDGVPCPADRWLLTYLLRKTWGFDGYVVSDCDAVNDVFVGHHYAGSRAQADALSLLAGTDLDCGQAYQSLLDAVAQGLLTEAQIDVALKRVVSERFRLGMFDPPTFPYAMLGQKDIDTPANAALALKLSRESMVLLKNDGVLPLDKSKVKRVAVIGDNADSIGSLEGNYNGRSSHPVTVLSGLQNELGKDVEIVYEKGCPLAAKPGENFDDSADERRAIDAAKSADVVIYVGGISPRLEGEEMHTAQIGFAGGDRTAIELPAVQETLVRALCATGKPVVFVCMSGSAIALPWEAEHVAAILQAWYPGENGGSAVADTLFGHYNPAGRLAVTFYAATADLPDFTDYSMANRTYRYFQGKPLYPFGFGLSYTTFAYGQPALSATKATPSDVVHVSVPVTNTGPMDGEEVVQLYARHLHSAVDQPIHSLIGFKRIALAKGATQTADIAFNVSQLRYWDANQKRYVVEAGKYDIQVASSAADVKGDLTLSLGK